MKLKLLLTLVLLLLSKNITSQNLPKGFSYIKDISPTIQSELRYCQKENFLGTSVNGYNENVLISSTKTVEALHKIQTELLKKELSLKIFDAYRPQTAVNHFIKWAREINDTIKKQEYYPDLNKRNLFRLGYIATRSGHSRGSSVDLTIVNLKTNTDLDMGSPYDFFGKISHTSHYNLTDEQKKNRQFLKNIMLKYGFRPYSNEWWHFTLRNEPFPKTYFDFPVE